VNKLAESCGMDEMERFHVQLCIVEAPPMVVLHAYRERRPQDHLLVTWAPTPPVPASRRREPIPRSVAGGPPDPDETEDGLLGRGRGLYSSPTDGLVS